MTDDPQYDTRLVQIETLLMHVQRDVEQLSKALIEQQAELESIKRSISRIAAVIDSEPEVRDPGLERPPHY
jgi:uncharacterized coiled-coil protein SlyX